MKKTNKNVGKKMSIDELAGIMKNSFVHLENKMDEKFEKVGNRIDGLEATMNHRFDEVDGRLMSLEKRIAFIN